MSKFIEKLIQIGYSDANSLAVEQIVNKLNSLGDNARKMLEVGIVQDELVELGFSQYTGLLSGMGKFIYIFKCGKSPIHVRFYNFHCEIDDYVFDYNPPTWQEDLLSKVKELI